MLLDLLPVHLVPGQEVLGGVVEGNRWSDLSLSHVLRYNLNQPVQVLSGVQVRIQSGLEVDFVVILTIVTVKLVMLRDVVSNILVQKY